MKHLLHKLSSLRLLMLLTVLLGIGSGTAWADTTTYTFTSKSWGATSEGSAANWTSGQDGGQFQSERGVQVSSSVTGANATSPISFTNVTKIVVTYSTNKSSGAGNITLKIGENNKYPKNVTSSGGTSDRTLEYLYNTKPESGNVQITVNCTTNSIYVKSIAITTSTSTPVTGVSLNKNATTLEVGDTETLTETVAPDNATNKNVSWESDNTDVATVNNGTVTAVAAGTANITVTTEDGSYTATCEVTVNAASKTAVNMTGFNAVETTIIKGNTTTTTVSNDQDGWTASYTYSSNDENIATVDENGVITAVNAGTTNINCALNIDENDENYKAGATTSMSVEITVTNPPYTVTFSDGGSVTEESAGAGVTLPSRSEKAGYAFAGWCETNVESATTTAPTIINAGSYTPTANIILYPVYTKTESGGGSQNKTESKTMSEIISENSYTVSAGSDIICYTAFYLDSDREITISTTGTANCGSFWGTSPNNDWRLYQNKSGNVIVSTTGGELTSVKFTFSATNSATLNYNSSSVTSGTAVSVSGTTVQFTVGNSGNATNGQIRITAIEVIYTTTGGGTTYYWSAPVAAAVERPEISIADNPFTFSTTATITCETEGAAIKYSFDGETWNNYSEPLTITEATTIYAKAVKNEDESTVASVTVTKNKVEPTVTIAATGITNTNVFEGTDAGSLVATVTYNDAAVEGAVVTWSGNNDAVATIDPSTGAVALVAAGSVTFTATFAGNSDYSEKTETYVMTVTNTDPNAPGTENNPYSVADAIAATPVSGTSADVYITGIVSAFYKTSIMDDGSNYRYYISDDGTTATQLLVYKGKKNSTDNFSSADDLQLGDIVTIYGGLTTYNSTKEVAADNYIVSLIRKPAAPTFSHAAGAVASGTEVTLSTTTDGAVIYYTTDGNEPTTSSDVYSEPISITEATTIKAIAVKDEISSDVATAAYTIAVPVATPTFSPAAGTFDSAQEVTISCTTNDAIIYYSYDNESWTEYTEALTIDETKTVYAKAEKQDMAPSAVASAEYQIQIPSIVFDGLDAPTYNFDFEAYATNIHFVSAYTTGDLAVVICDSEGNPETYDWFSAELISGYYVRISVTQNYDKVNTRTAYFKVTADNTESLVFTVTQAKYVADFATLPFEWEGGTSSAFKALEGVTTSGLGSDYAGINAPYLIKLDTNGDYIVVKTDSQPGVVTVDVKMIGGSSTSSITVQQSADGSEYTDVQNLSISGSQNATLTLETTNAFAATTRYVKLYFNKGSNVAVGAITIAKATSDPAINADSDVELTAEDTAGEIEYSISNPDGVSVLVASEKVDVDWISDVTVDNVNSKVTFTTTVNTGAERTATITLTYGEVVKDVIVTQAEHVEILSYSLATTITSGKHYIITNNSNKAMGAQATNYRSDVEISINEGNTSFASNANVYEFVICGPDVDGYYTIYDEVNEGYLYAAGGNSDNYLMNKAELDDNGRWTITFEDDKAIIKAQGGNTRNWMRYNSSSSRFSCYSSSQNDIYLYEKDGEDAPTESITIGAAGYTTYTTQNPVSFPYGVTAYIATAVNTSTIHLEEILDAPARTPIILKAEPNTYSLEKDYAEVYKEVIKDTPNLLKSSDGKVEGNQTTIYALGKKSDVVGFYLVKNGAKVPAGKAYLEVDDSGSVKEFLTFDFDGGTTTGIESVKSDLQRDVIFNLAGQRMNKIQRGVNIVNGKKVLVK